MEASCEIQRQNKPSFDPSRIEQLPYLEPVAKGALDVPQAGYLDMATFI